MVHVLMEPRHRRPALRVLISLVPLVPFSLIVGGLLLPWERGYQWSTIGWDTGCGRALAVLAFLMAWIFALRMAGALHRGFYLAVTAIMALAAVGTPVLFYFEYIGRHDPGVVDGFIHTHPGMGLATTLGGGLLLGGYVGFRWRSADPTS